MVVLAIDPGQEKCGVAVLSHMTVLHKKVYCIAELFLAITSLVQEYNVETIIVGDGTGSERFHQQLADKLPTYTVLTVDESYTTELARKRYWQENPPHGLRRFVPQGMQVPPVPYDDYVAVILAERFLANAFKS